MIEIVAADRAREKNRAPWWQSAVLYQIYPRSFQDSDDDGVGDLKGILERLPYLVDLGVEALWLSPVFPSPMADFGYDISNYTDIAPLFGSLEDFDALVAAAHRSDVRVLLDLVPNHTSNRHPWFADGRRSREDPRRIGTSGAIRRRTAGRRTTGCPSSAAAFGNSMRRPASTIITPSLPRSPT